MTSPWYEELALDARNAIESRSLPRIMKERQKVEREYDAEEISREERDRLLEILEDGVCSSCG